MKNFIQGNFIEMFSQRTNRKGSFSFFKSFFARFLADNKSSSTSGNNPRRTVALMKRLFDGVITKSLSLKL